MAALDAAVAAAGAEGQVAEVLSIAALSAAEAWIRCAEAADIPPGDLLKQVLVNMARAENGDFSKISR
jgi:hypothetical protein